MAITTFLVVAFFVFLSGIRLLGALKLHLPLWVSVAALAGLALVIALSIAYAVGWATLMNINHRIERGRMRRRRAGQCVNCGYSVSGITNDRCPECGYWDPARVSTGSH